METLTGHTSAETAYVVDDDPYGLTLRTSIRYWLEHKTPHGYRLVSQTRNPKTGGWNKPKPGTYHPLAVMVLTDEGRVTLDTLRPWGWSTEDQIAAFERRHAGGLGERERATIAGIRAMLRAADRITVTVRSDDGTPRQSAEEQRALCAAVLADELRRAA